MRPALAITPNEPLPSEIIGLADEASHRAGDMLMQASALSLNLRRVTSFGPQMQPGLAALAEEGRLFAAAVVAIGERIASLQARAGA